MSSPESALQRSGPQGYKLFLELLLRPQSKEGLTPCCRPGSWATLDTCKNENRNLPMFWHGVLKIIFLFLKVIIEEVISTYICAFRYPPNKALKPKKVERVK